ncbi:MAG: 4Fe-4S dicluster domain-containing protein [Deltaproteobacteria bacterium]|nr:4Fe-4S dicluster domain-containing protein [Deltaproteobacteria bacterium]
MDSSRRSFLKIAGVSAIGLSTAPVSSVLAAGGGGEANQPRMLANSESLTARRWAMVVDTRKIHSNHDIEPIIEACHRIHNVPKLENKNHEIKWIWEEEFKHAFPTKGHEYLNEHIKHLPFPVLCNHCKNPPCVRACPTQATFKRESDGVVLMDFHRCIGCRFCMAACPFGSRSFNFRDPVPFIAKVNKEYPTRCTGVVEKCNFCAERLAVGKLPACVEASNGILSFGDVDDPDSNVRELLRTHYTIRRKESLGTEPSIYYIV